MHVGSENVSQTMDGFSLGLKVYKGVITSLSISLNKAVDV